MLRLRVVPLLASGELAPDLLWLGTKSIVPALHPSHDLMFRLVVAKLDKRPVVAPRIVLERVGHGRPAVRFDVDQEVRVGILKSHVKGVFSLRLDAPEASVERCHRLGAAKEEQGLVETMAADTKVDSITRLVPRICLALDPRGQIQVVVYLDIGKLAQVASVTDSNESLKVRVVPSAWTSAMLRNGSD